MTRYLCEDCGHVTTEPKRANHPFILGEQILGCPECGEVYIVLACEVDGCLREASCGTNTDDGYRRTCGPHAPLFGGPHRLGEI